MFKKVVWFIGLFVCLFICVSNAQASGFSYADGWFDNNKGQYTVSPTTASTILDNNLNTGYVLKSRESNPVEITLNDAVEVEALTFYVNGESDNASSIRFIFYNKGVQVFEKRFTEVSSYVTLEPSVKFDKIRISNPAGTTSYDYSFLREIEFFDKDSYPVVANIKVNEGYNDATVSYDLPDGALSASFYLNEVYVGSESTGKYTLKNLKSNTEYTLGITTVYKDGISRMITTPFKTKAIPDLPSEFVTVESVTDTTANIFIGISKLPILPKKIVIYDKDNKVVDEYIVMTNVDMRPTIRNMEAGTKYTYRIEAVYQDEVKKSIDLEIQTVEANREVKELTATATSKDINLTWKMPDYKGLDVARIYRQKEDVGMFKRLFMASSNYEPIFETNGTTFKDLTVKADTEYTYKVTTVDTKGNETDGKTVKVRTKKMTVSGGGAEKDENGDYVITWTSPTTGKIKVLVGGKEYAIVSASDKKIVIPKDKMAFDILGNPDVQLVPIDEDGNEGLPSKPGAGEGTGNGGGIGDIVGGSDLADLLSPSNLLKAGMGLVALVGAILLLRMAFVLAPKLIRLIRNALKKEKDVNVYVRRGARE